MSHLVVQSTADTAIKFVLPMIEGMMTSPERPMARLKRSHLHIVVLDPGKKYGTCRFEDAIYAEHSIGDPTQWEYDYKSIARAKAELAWRTGMSTRAVAQLAPHVYLKGETIHAGGVYFEGIVVAVSGVQSYFDEMFATAIAAAIKALAIESSENAREVDKDFDFWGQEKEVLVIEE